MIFQKDFSFKIPSREEFEIAKEIDISNPDWLDAREIWIIENFKESDFE